MTKLKTISNAKTCSIIILGIFICMSFVMALQVEQQVKVHVLAQPEIFLGDNLGGDDSYDFDGRVYATLNADPFSSACYVNWEGEWEKIAVNETSANYTYYTDGIKQVGYKCSDDYGNNLTSEDSIDVLVGWAPTITISSPLAKLYPKGNISIIVDVNVNVSKILFSDNNGFRTLCTSCSHYGGAREFSDGHHNFVIKVIDNFNRAFYKEVEFDVDSHAPKILSVEPRNNGYSNGEFKIRYTENLLQNITLFWRNVGETEYNKAVKYDCPSGRNQECIFNLDFGQVNKQIEFYFEVMNMLNYDRSGVNLVQFDSIEPEIIVNSPSNEGSFGNRNILLNIGLNEDVEKLEYIDWNDGNRWRGLCRNCNFYNRTRAFSEGKHNLTIRATDKAGNVGATNIIFFIDSKKPVISRTEPGRNSVVNGSEFYIKYTEENLKKITLFYGLESEEAESETKEDCLPGRNQECFFNDIKLSDYNGEYIEYWFEVSDGINSAESRKTRILVDTKTPELKVNSPENKNYGRKVAFNITVSEKVIIEYMDNSDAKPKWARLTTNADEYGNERTKTKSFKKGTHDVLIRATDKAGNADIEEIKFNVDY